MAQVSSLSPSLAVIQKAVASMQRRPSKGKPGSFTQLDDYHDELLESFREATSNALSSYHTYNRQEVLVVSRAMRNMKKSFPADALKRVGADMNALQQKREATEAAVTHYLAELNTARDHIVDMICEEPLEFVVDPFKDFREEWSAKSDAQIEEEIRDRTRDLKAAKITFQEKLEQTTKEFEATSPALTKILRDSSASLMDVPEDFMDDDYEPSSGPVTNSSQALVGAVASGKSKAPPSVKPAAAKPLTIYDKLNALKGK